MIQDGVPFKFLSTSQKWLVSIIYAVTGLFIVGILFIAAIIGMMFAEIK